GQGRERPRGDAGTSEIKGPNVFRGYWRLRGRTAEDFRADGFFVTGDIGTMDEEGRVSMLGRAKDVIISGGLNIYPKKIEDELDAIDGVAESAVIGVPHPDLGESVVAVVIPRGTVPDESEIIARLATRLAKFKLPKRIFTTRE